MKKWLLLFFLLSACSNTAKEIPTSYIDVNTLPECDDRISIKTRGFEYFEGDNGDILFIRKFDGKQCLKRKKCSK